MQFTEYEQLQNKLDELQLSEDHPTAGQLDEIKTLCQQYKIHKDKGGLHV